MTTHREYQEYDSDTGIKNTLKPIRTFQVVGNYTTGTKISVYLSFKVHVHDGLAGISTLCGPHSKIRLIEQPPSGELLDAMIGEEKWDELYIRP